MIFFKFRSGVVVYFYNPNTQETEAGLWCEFKAFLSYRVSSRKVLVIKCEALHFFKKREK